MDVITSQTPLHHRRLVLIADITTLAKYEENNNDFLKAHLRIPLRITNLAVPLVSTTIELGFHILERLRLKKFKSLAKGEIDYCAENFRFPPQHPVNGVVYACPDYQPEYYVPIANFHEYAFQLKMGAFIEMCSSLGAKKCSIVFAEENGKELNFDGSVNAIDENKLKATFKKSSSQSFASDYEFPKPNQIVQFDSPWIETEPSWSSVQRIRLKNGITRSRIEFNYSDEMGITSQIAGKLSKAGINLGGSFNEIKKTKLIYEVEFWNM